MCKIEGCSRPIRARDMCTMHYQRWRRNERPGGKCTITGCNKRTVALGFCPMHYERLRSTFDLGGAEMRRAANGEGTQRPDGYRMIHDESGKQVREHRKIVEKVLGHKISSKVVIHHWNHDPADNRHKNLLVCPSQAYHMLIEQRQAAIGWEGPK